MVCFHICDILSSSGRRFKGNTCAACCVLETLFFISISIKSDLITRFSSDIHGKKSAIMYFITILSIKARNFADETE